MKSLFPLYSLAEVQRLPGCVLPLIRLELQRHLSLNTDYTSHALLPLLAQAKYQGGVSQAAESCYVLFSLLFKEGKYIIERCLFVTSTFGRQDTGFVMASVKLPLSPAYCNTISHKGKLVYCHYIKGFKA